MNQTGNPCYDSGDEKCGRLEFKLRLGRMNGLHFR